MSITPAATDLYGELAHWYHRAYLWDVKDEIRFYLRTHIEHGHSLPVRVLEPGCGSGRYLSDLFTVHQHMFGQDQPLLYTGYDRSDAMLALANQLVESEELPQDNIRLLNASMETYHEQELYDLIFIGINTFRYLVTDEDVSAFFEHHYQMLAADGLMFLNFNYASPPGSKIEDISWDVRYPDGAATVTWRTPDENLETMIDDEICEVTVKRPGSEPAHYRTQHHQRLWTRSSFVEFLRQQGVFSLQGVFSDQFRPVILDHEFPGDLLNLYHVLRRRP